MMRRRRDFCLFMSLRSFLDGHPGTVMSLVAVNFGHSWGDFIKSSMKSLFPFFPRVVDIDSCRQRLHVKLENVLKVCCRTWNLFP